MNSKVVLMAFVWLFMLSAIPRAQFALLASAGSPEREVGVKVGDWVKYDKFIVTWGSSDPSEQPPASLYEINETEWSSNAVDAISETKITFQTVNHYKNGTETSSVACVDVATGEGNGTFMFISQGLVEGDFVYTSADFQDEQINKTISRTYMGVTRETNYMYLEVWDIAVGSTYYLYVYWDGATGILTEWMLEEINVSEDSTVTSSVSFKMIDNNIWAGLPDTTPPVAKADADRTVIEDTSVSFDASASYDLEGAIISYEWDFGDGTKESGMRTTHIYKEPGTYAVTLTVRDVADNIGTDMITVTVTVPETFPSQILAVSVIAVSVVVVLIFWRRRGKKHKKRER